MNQSTKSFKVDVHHLPIDLLDLKSVQSAAQAFSKLENRLDVLINNAGVSGKPRSCRKFPVDFLDHGSTIQTYS
jgi:short-subunit dehydrogenase